MKRMLVSLVQLIVVLPYLYGQDTCKRVSLQVIESSKTDSLNTCPHYFDSTLNRIIYQTVDNMPQFPNGKDSLQYFIAHNLMWPEIDSDFKGKVFIRCIVEPDGCLTNKKVIRGLFKEADHEAMRVVDKMPAWIPGRCQNEIVPVQIVIVIPFIWCF